MHRWRWQRFRRSALFMFSPSVRFVLFQALLNFSLSMSISLSSFLSCLVLVLNRPQWPFHPFCCQWSVIASPVFILYNASWQLKWYKFFLNHRHDEWLKSALNRFRIKIPYRTFACSWKHVTSGNECRRGTRTFRNELVHVTQWLAVQHHLCKEVPILLASHPSSQPIASAAPSTRCIDSQPAWSSIHANDGDDSPGAPPLWLCVTSDTDKTRKDKARHKAKTKQNQTKDKGKTRHMRK